MSRAGRPVLRYHGGKWLLAPWILGFFPPHRCYVEPFGGAASVLMRKPRSYAEVYNELDDEVVNVFRVLRSPTRARRLAALLRLTPFSRDDFAAAYRASKDPVERARRTLVKAFMGFGSNSLHDLRPPGSTAGAPTGFRATSNRAGTTPAHDWQHFPGHIAGFCERLQGVVIERREAQEVMAQHDAPATLHYVDPPYLPETRTGLNKRRQHGVLAMYRHEFSADDHRELAVFLRGLRGMVVLSGYPSPLYEELYEGWERHERQALADGARPRTECLWLNPACVAARRGQQAQLVAL